MATQVSAGSEAHTPIANAHLHQPSDNFTPSLWGDRFLSYASMAIKKEKHVQELKELVKAMLIAPVQKASQKLELIDRIQRLGVSYHFEDEIDEILKNIHMNSYDCDDLENDIDDLYTTALRFRLLRQQGYHVSCDVFKKFKNGDGDFRASLGKDVPGLLSFYEATHLRLHGEDILDEALTFTTHYLGCYSVSAQGLDSSAGALSKQVTHALSQPLWKGIPRLEARHYLSVYEECDTHDENLLTFAKLDFNLVQQVHQKELAEMTRWWKDLDFVNKLPFIRHRIVECYLWAFSAYFEPKYYFARRFLCKVIAIITAIDDIYDVHGTLEDLEPFTEAIMRWDISAKAALPEYMQVCYQALLDIYSETEQELADEGNLYGIHYARESMKIIVRGYIQEAKWFHQKYIPTTDEHMQVALTTSTFLLSVTAAVRMKDIVTKESLDWLINDPKIVNAASIVGRLRNDIASYQYDYKRGGDVASAVECYMKQYGATEEETIVELNKQVDNAWKDITEGLLRPTTIPMPILLPIVNITRFCEVIYKCGDDLTGPGVTLKERVTSLFINPVPI